MRDDTGLTGMALVSPDEHHDIGRLAGRLELLADLRHEREAEVIGGLALGRVKRGLGRPVVRRIRPRS